MVAYFMHHIPAYLCFRINVELQVVDSTQVACKQGTGTSGQVDQANI